MTLGAPTLPRTLWLMRTALRSVDCRGINPYKQQWPLFFYLPSGAALLHLVLFPSALTGGSERKGLCCNEKAEPILQLSMKTAVLANGLLGGCSEQFLSFLAMGVGLGMGGGVGEQAES